MAVLKKDGVTVIKTVELAVTLRDRMVGLLGRQSLGKDRALHISSCGSIHTFFMKFSLDLVFLGESLHVVRIVRNAPPNRTVLGGAGARSVLEMEAGWFPNESLAVGDRVEFYC